MMCGKNKTRAGLLCLGSKRFIRIGTDNRNYTAVCAEKIAFYKKEISVFSDIVDPGIIYDTAGAQRCLDEFYNQKTDYVIVMFLSWAEDSAWIKFLRDLPELPVMLITANEYGGDFTGGNPDDQLSAFLSACGLVGSLVGSASVRRLNRKIFYATGSSGHIIGQIYDFSRAAAARSALRKSVFGLIGSYNELMKATYIDPYVMFTKIGPELRFFSYAQYNKEIDQITAADTESFILKLTSQYTRCGSFSEECFQASARASLALALLAKKNNCDASVLNDVGTELFETIGCRPGFYAQYFNQTDTIAVPEGDLGAAVIAYTLKKISGRPVNFTEPFYIRKDEDIFYAGHAGINDYTDEKWAKNVLISEDTRFAQSGYKFAGAPFAWYRFSAGIKTFAHFSQNADGFGITAFCAESLPGPHEIPGYAHGAFFLPNAASAFRTILDNGATQHFMISDGNLLAALSFFARICGFSFTAIPGVEKQTQQELS